MPFTAAQRTSFFTNATQMGLTNAQRNALQDEGLVNINDFEDFFSDELKSAFKNLRSANPPVPIPARASSRLITVSIA